MLELEHLSKTYADGTRALSDINLSVREGEIVSLIGGSGCGKTTLLRLIAGLDRTSACATRAFRPSASCSRNRAFCRGCRWPTTSPSAWST
jgi:ABC-type nitrate/sulfonate/bicarbonate transport system ATPase subunit